MTKSIKNNYMLQNGGGGSSNEKNGIDDQLKKILIDFIEKIPNINIEPKLKVLFKSLIPIPQVGPIQVPPPRSSKKSPEPPPRQSQVSSQVSTQVSTSASAPPLPPRPSQKTVHSGGNNANINTDKLEKNIARLYNCYVLLQLYNQNGGIDNKLSFQVKKRLDKKIAELIVKPAHILPVHIHIHTNYLKDYIGEGGVEIEDQIIRYELTNIINDELNLSNTLINNLFTPALLTNILIINDNNKFLKNIFKDIKIPIFQYIPNIGVFISNEFFKLIIQDLDLTQIKKHIKEGQSEGGNLKGGFDIWHEIQLNIRGLIFNFPDIGKKFTELFNLHSWRMPDLSNLQKFTVTGRRNSSGQNEWNRVI
jgi:hypothetical protein